MSHTLVYVDEAYDRQRASDGVSRFGSYLRRSRLLAGGVEEPLDAVGFAAEVWRIACPPVMSPGYVDYTGRVYEVRVAGGTDDPGVLVAELGVRLPHSRWMPGRGLAGWRDWAQIRTQGWSGGEPVQLVEPDDRHRAVLYAARLRLPIGVEDLPAPGGCLDVTEAKAAVAVIVAAVNTGLGPVAAEVWRSWAGAYR